MVNGFILCFTDSRNGRDNLSELQLVQNGGLTGGIEPDHEDTGLTLKRKDTKKKMILLNIPWPTSSPTTVRNLSPSLNYLTTPECDVKCQINLSNLDLQHFKFLIDSARYKKG